MKNENDIWFPFISKSWLDSQTVQLMTSAERGVYIQLLAGYHHYGYLPKNVWDLCKLLHIHYETATHFLRKYSRFTTDSLQDCSKFVVPILDEMRKKVIKSPRPPRRGKRIELEVEEERGEIPPTPTESTLELEE